MGFLKSGCNSPELPVKWVCLKIEEAANTLCFLSVPIETKSKRVSTTNNDTPKWSSQNPDMLNHGHCGSPHLLGPSLTFIYQDSVKLPLTSFNGEWKHGFRLSTPLWNITLSTYTWDSIPICTFVATSGGQG